MITQFPYKNNAIKIPYGILPFTTNETNLLKPKDIWTYALLSFCQGSNSSTVIDYQSFSELLGLDVSDTAHSLKQLISQGWIMQKPNGEYSCAVNQIPEEKREYFSIEE